MFSFKILSLTAVFSAVQSVHSFLDTDSSSNVAVYWGMFHVCLNTGSDDCRSEFRAIRPDAAGIFL